MNAVRRRKLIGLLFILITLLLVSLLVLYALRQNISLFYSPTQISEGQAPLNQAIRVGGMVVKNSVKRNQDDLSVRFQVTDFKHTLEIEYTGILPDLFREGQGIVAEGILENNKHFKALEVLAKHDENYMPPEVRDSLAKQ
ncbi:cytochrome c maturation protein CcmE [Legionella yabuuchiae]|uniref:cytochrome c maturation protein CcmE n=1 Tax=Legionella yabuuchiae TaxID=376727 RepID=UPI001056D0D5|nr:cytochrome c maturation protein CcmE [Legionella yabuuchiae]